MAEGPARVAGVSDKGQLAPGSDADLVIFDPEATCTVDAGSLHHRNPITPYDKRELSGQVVSTWFRGQQVDFKVPHGHFLYSIERVLFYLFDHAESITQRPLYFLVITQIHCALLSRTPCS